jgi:hypothetical protein
VVPVSPLGFSNLALWLDPTTLVADADAGGALVAQWTDRSSNRVTVAQSNPAAMPSVATYLGRQVASFMAPGPGANDRWLQTAASDVAAVDFGKSDVLLEAVVSTSTAVTGYYHAYGDSYGTVYAKCDQSALPYKGLQLFASRGSGGAPGGGFVGVNLLVSLEGNTEDGNFHLLGVERAGDMVTLWLDGTQVGSQLTVANEVVDSTTDPLLIGGREDGTNPFFGYLGDVVLLVGTLAPDDRESLEAYLMNEYAIPLFASDRGD